MKKSKIEIYQRKDGRWNWRERISGNNTVGGLEGDGFASKRNAKRNFLLHARRMACAAFAIVVIEKKDEK